MLMNTLGYSVDSDTTLETRIAAIRAQDGDVFVAERDGQVVGCINTIIDIRLAEGITGEIVSLVVAEGERGMGIGKGLIKVAEEWLDGRCDQIRIRANAKRANSHQFYERLGYNQIKQQKIFIKKLR